MAAPNIRRLVPADAEAYRALMLEAYARHPDAFTSSPAERAKLPLTWWQSRLDDGAHVPDLVFGGFERDALAGAVGLSFETREKARHKSTLFGMYVADAYRHRGLGRALVATALAAARAREGVRLMQLTVTDRNADARVLYERCGFVQFGLEPLAVAVGSSYVAKVHMWCDLRA
jgi:GNAT superfamily N-acetyltransferase